MQSKQPKPILVVEDSPEDFEVLERACKKAQLDNPLIRCKSGQEALDFLYKTGEYENLHNTPTPAMVLLDLNMPGTNGHEILEKIKNDSMLKTLPIVVLSTSSSVEDVQSSYRSGANSYISKPEDMKGYVAMAEMIKDYWFSFCCLPLNWREA